MVLKSHTCGQTVFEKLNDPYITAQLGPYNLLIDTTFMPENSAARLADFLKYRPDVLVFSDSAGYKALYDDADVTAIEEYMR